MENGFAHRLVVELIDFGEHGVYHLLYFFSFHVLEIGRDEV
jgi:hypothetical protein